MSLARAESNLPFPGFVTTWRISFAIAVVLAFASLAITVQNREPVHLILATTTSTRDTGLLDYLDPIFTNDTGIEVRYVAVGTGLALAYGRQGDADVVLVHAPDLERTFVFQDHQGYCWSPVMYNRFMIVGPASDPAGITGLSNATEAFRRIWQTRSLFISRGDGSGTNVKEGQIWARVGYTPSTTNDSWYLETGQGMGATLTVASEKGAYTLTDDGTFYALASTLNLQIRVAGDEFLFNQYHVIPVDPVAHPNVNFNAALTYARWLVSPRVQGLIGNFTVAGHVLFIPNGEDAC